MKLLKNNTYLLLIDEEAEISEGNYVYSVLYGIGQIIRDIGGESTKRYRPLIAKFQESEVQQEYGRDGIWQMDVVGEKVAKNNCKKVIAYYPLTKESKELDLPLLPVTPKDKWGVHETHCCEKHGCKYGDNDCCVAIGIAKAKYSCEYCDDDENDMQFTLKDVKKAIEMARMTFPTDKLSCDRYSTKEIIQSLSTQQLPKEFISEYINTNSLGSETNGYDSGNFILKTITNSEGKEELVGTYKY